MNENGDQKVNTGTGDLENKLKELESGKELIRIAKKKSK